MNGMERGFWRSLQNIFLTFIWLSRLIVHLVTFFFFFSKNAFGLCFRWNDGSVSFSLCYDVYSQRWHEEKGGKEIKQMPKEADDWYSARHRCITARSTKLDGGAAQKRKTKEHRQASKAHAMCTGRQKGVQRHQTDAADHICWEILRGAQRKTGWHRAIINGRLARRHGWNASAVVQLFRRYFSKLLFAPQKHWKSNQLVCDTAHCVLSFSLTQWRPEDESLPSVSFRNRTWLLPVMLLWNSARPISDLILKVDTVPPALYEAEAFIWAQSDLLPQERPLLFAAVTSLLHFLFCRSLTKRQNSNQLRGEVSQLFIHQTQQVIGLSKGNHCGSRATRSWLL